MKVYRLEFLQPDGRWTGPYTAEWITPAAFKLRKAMLKNHKVTRPYPASSIFAKNPGKDRYVCASPSMGALKAWFGRYLGLYKAEGGHVGTYEVPVEAIAERDEEQIVYQQRQATLIVREGEPIKQVQLVEKLYETGL
jgi:hypothetical protein